jgi:chromate transporter
MSSSKALSRAREVFAAFLKLGCVSFGGPVAHIGYFNDEFVARRRWLSAEAYADTVALCQFLPGPASSQVGMAIGLARAGLPGLFAAWLGFTLPSALFLIAFAYGVQQWGDLSNASWLHGLKIAAAAVVAHAIVTMARTLCAGLIRMAVAAGAALCAALVLTAIGQIAAILVAGLLGWAFLKDRPPLAAQDHPAAVSPRIAVIALMLFFALLVAFPFISGGVLMDLADGFYRTGAMVFGGGHVVLPLLQREVVTPGLMDNQFFLAGYGAAQAVPGPLFTFAGFLGAAIAGGWGAAICLGAIFLPSVLLIVGVTPFWQSLRRHTAVRSALSGVNAAVVGILAAAFYDPIFPSAILDGWDAAIAAALFVLLVFLRAPSWLIVALGAAAASVTASL